MSWISNKKVHGISEKLVLCAFMLDFDCLLFFFKHSSAPALLLREHKVLFFQMIVFHSNATMLTCFKLQSF